MMMTYFRIKPWLSNRMIICDRPSITDIQTICSAGLYTFVYYLSTFTNLVITTFWGGIEWSLWCLPYVSIVLWMVSKRWNAERQFHVLYCFTSCGRFEYWIEGVWVNDRVVVLRTHTLRNCFLGHCRSAGQASPWLYDADLWHKIHFWVCYQDSGGLTLDAKWCA